MTNLQVYLIVLSYVTASTSQSLVCLCLDSKAEVLNMVLMNIFATFYVTNSPHKPFFTSDNFNLSHTSFLAKIFITLKLANFPPLHVHDH